MATFYTSRVSDIVCATVYGGYAVQAFKEEDAYAVSSAAAVSVSEEVHSHLTR